MPYVNYHKHSMYSNIITTDSVVTNEDYCKRAVELGHQVVSSCEHGTPGNYRQLSELAAQYGLKWRYVMEGYFVKDRDTETLKDKTNCHMILAAKTAKGIGDLNALMSEANITGYYYKPRFDLDLLLQLDPKDVFVTTACVAGVWKYGEEEATRLIHLLRSHFRDSFMLEVQAHNTDSQKEVNRMVLDFYRNEGIPIIAGMDSHFIRPEDRALRDQRLEANHIIYEDEDGWDLDYPSDDDVFQRFRRQGILSDQQISEALNNTEIFLDFEDVVLDKSMKLPTIYPNLTQEERNEKYRQLIREKWLEYRKTVPQERWPEYEAGIKYEVDTITETNMSDYFLLDYELVKRGKELGGMLTYTGRGSSPSFVTNMLLGFTSIDRFTSPITMYPDRFISKDRLLSGSTPDIDMNCGDVEPFAKAQAEIMGPWHSAPMVAFGTLKRLSAWKMYCRAADVSFSIANELGEALKRYELDVKHADEDEEEPDIMDYVPAEYREHLRMSEKYLGLVDSISPHPCAHVVTNLDIRREYGVIRLASKTGKKKVVYAAFVDGQTCERFGGLKNDLLKVDVVKVNADIYKRIGIPQPTVPQLMEIVNKDKATWEMYAKGYTLGLNQAEQEKSTQKVMRYRPRNVSEMSAFVAGIRPAFQSMIDKLLDRQHFDYGIPAFDKLLQTKEVTSSFILYQEQMMKVLQWAGFSAPESYAAIKAIAKKHPEKVLPMKERFNANFSKRLIDEEGAAPEVANDMTSKVWTIMEDACAYGFNSCLIGSTKIWRAPGRNRFAPTIEEMYLIKNDADFAKRTGHKDLHSKYISYGYGKALSLCEDGRIRENKIVDIRPQGKRPVFRMTMASGREVICTDNHKFPVGSYDNLVMLRDLNVGDQLFVKGVFETSKFKSALSNGDFVPNIPKKGEMGFQKRPDGVSVIFESERLRHVKNKDVCEGCGREYSDDAYFELHHVDGNRTNNSPDNYAWLCNSCHKKAHYKMGRTRRYEKGISSLLDTIVSIEPAGEEEVYDVEMADPYHNFVIDNGLVVGNSHALSVALDSLYTAWAKAHYPYETYVSLLEAYSSKGDKARIAKAKTEMGKAFGITVTMPRFRQDNRGYFVDKENHTISDSLASVKHLSARVADALYKLRNAQYDCFVDLLRELVLTPALNTQSIEILIRMGYFEEFGSTGRLLNIWREFTEGENRFSKSHVKATQERRLDALRQYEKQLPECTIPVSEVIQFEIEYFGVPYSVFPKAVGQFAVLDLDTKYSPKARLYNIAKGTEGVMKIRKATFALTPLEFGSIIRMDQWKSKQAYQYNDGKAIPKVGVNDLWLEQYTLIAS